MADSQHAMGDDQSATYLDDTAALITQLHFAIGCISKLEAKDTTVPSLTLLPAKLSASLRSTDNKTALVNGLPRALKVGKRYAYDFTAAGRFERQSGESTADELEIAQFYTAALRGGGDWRLRTQNSSSRRAVTQRDEYKREFERLTDIIRDALDAETETLARQTSAQPTAPQSGTRSTLDKVEEKQSSDTAGTDLDAVARMTLYAFNCAMWDLLDPNRIKQLIDEFDTAAAEAGAASARQVSGGNAAEDDNLVQAEQAVEHVEQVEHAEHVEHGQPTGTTVSQNSGRKTSLASIYRRWRDRR